MSSGTAKMPAALARALEGGTECAHELPLLVAFAVTRTHRVDHSLERQLARAGDDRVAGGKWPPVTDQAIGLGLQLRPRGARDDPCHAAAVREVAVRRVDDGFDRLFQEVAVHHLEGAAGRYFFLREDLRRRRFGTLPPARRASERPMAIACLRLFKRLPERPLRSVPRLRLCIARLTLERALGPYLAIALLNFRF